MRLDKFRIRNRENDNNDSRTSNNGNSSSSRTSESATSRNSYSTRTDNQGSRASSISIFGEEDNDTTSRANEIKLYGRSRQITELNSMAQDANEEDTEEIHGLADDEYLELQAKLKDYGIEYENLSHGNFSNVAQTMAKQIGKTWCYDTIAASYDSVLDLVLDEKFNNAIRDMGISRDDWNWDSIIKNYGARLEKDYGIVINKTSDRNYWVSLVDENGNVIQDEQGHLAQIKKTDCMLPDGLAQDVEKFASAAIDAMGYDCVSILDFTPEEYALIKEMASLDIKNSELGTASSIKDKYRGASGGGNYLSNYNIVSKSTESWSKNRKAYFSNTGSSVAGKKGVNSNGNGETSTTPTEQIEQNKNSLKIRISQGEFDRKVKEEMKEDSSLTKNQAEEIISKNYYVES